MIPLRTRPPFFLDRCSKARILPSAFVSTGLVDRASRSQRARKRNETPSRHAKRGTVTLLHTQTAKPIGWYRRGCLHSEQQPVVQAIPSAPTSATKFLTARKTRSDNLAPRFINQDCGCAPLDYLPATEISFTHTLGLPTPPGNFRSLPTATMFFSTSKKLPATVTCSTGCAFLPFSTR